MNKRMMTFMGSMLTVVVAFMAFVLTSCGSGNTPEAVALAAIDDVKSGNWSAYVDKMQFKKEMTPEGKEQMVKLLEEKGQKSLDKKDGIKSAEVLGCEMAEDGQSAKVKLKIVYGNGEEDTSKLDMVLVDGKWKIQTSK